MNLYKTNFDLYENKDSRINLKGFMIKVLIFNFRIMRNIFFCNRKHKMYINLY
jgi:hypothetical protein